MKKIDPKQAKSLFCFFSEQDNTENIPTSRNKKAKNTSNKIQRQNWKTCFEPTLHQKNTRIARKTTVLFASRNQNNKHNPTHKNRTKETTQTKQKIDKNKETRKV